MNEKLIIPFDPKDLSEIKCKMLNWLQTFSIFSYLDNNQYHNKPNKYELLVGAGINHIFKDYPTNPQRWVMGHISYDYKNAIEPSLSSEHKDNIGFAPFFWYEPQIVIYIPYNENNIYIEAETPTKIWGKIYKQSHSCASRRPAQPSSSSFYWQNRFTEEDYIKAIKTIKDHIVQGDCYELNFCVESFCQNISIEPLTVFDTLNRINPSPFAALYRNEEKWLICASPERFLYKNHDEIIAQPIKGTIKRSTMPIEDDALKLQLLKSEKDKAENIMIVDLMRNDLAKSCEVGSIEAPEIFGLYTFPTLHHLISSVRGTLKYNISIQEIICNAFPMGSMTGAPKVKVMELIEKYELSQRGIYAGTVGYINPEGDFDFNVVIRSLMYNQNTQYLSYQTGGAITYDSNPEDEWNEVLLKAAAIKKIFE